jgi:hypothetical protein
MSANPFLLKENKKKSNNKPLRFYELFGNEQSSNYLWIFSEK